MLKQHLTRKLVSLAENLVSVEMGPEAEAPSDASANGIGPLPEHITLETPVEKVVVVRLGAGGKKADAKTLISDLAGVFAGIHQNGGFKAIVLAGNYADFLIEAGNATAEEAVLEFQRLMAETTIPVIAALEGDANSHVWLISLLCDACVYSQTATYSSAAIAQSPVLRSLRIALEKLLEKKSCFRPRITPAPSCNGVSARCWWSRTAKSC